MCRQILISAGKSLFREVSFCLNFIHFMFILLLHSQKFLENTKWHRVVGYDFERRMTEMPERGATEVPVQSSSGSKSKGLKLKDSQ